MERMLPMSAITSRAPHPRPFRNRPAARLSLAQVAVSWALLPIFAIALGCGSPCRPGTVQFYDRCVAVPDEAPPAPPPPCGMDCPAETPLCDEALGRCVACLSDADCDAAAPLCQAGACTPCPDPATCGARCCGGAQWVAHALRIACVGAAADEAALNVAFPGQVPRLEARACQPPERLPDQKAIAAAFDDGRIGLSTERLVRCRSSTGAAVYDACLSVFAGRALPGQPCQHNRECESDNCIFSPDCTNGTCGEGPDCDAVRGCRPGRACVEGQCRAVAPGQPCGLGGDCGRDDLYCSADSRCRPRADRGESCADRPCLGSAQCNPRSQLCTRLPNPGEACFGICEGDALCIDDICRARVATDQPCSARQPCAAGHRCQQGTCRPVRKPGQACTPGDPCVFGTVCRDGQCQGGAFENEACGPAGFCVEGRCTAADLCQRANLGDPCSLTDLIPCQTGLRCDGTTCIATAIEGTACQASPECAPGLSCQALVCTKECSTP